MTELGNRAAEAIVKAIFYSIIFWGLIASFVWGVVFLIGAI